MSAPPKTVIKATPVEVSAIRAAVRNADTSKINPMGSVCRKRHAMTVNAETDGRAIDPL